MCVICEMFRELTDEPYENKQWREEAKRLLSKESLIEELKKQKSFLLGTFELEELDSIPGFFKGVGSPLNSMFVSILHLVNMLPEKDDKSLLFQVKLGAMSACAVDLKNTIEGIFLLGMAYQKSQQQIKDAVQPYEGRNVIQ